jgi:hypothetical protein
MTDNPILAAIQATRYADAIMSRTAERLDEPHHDWQPRYKGRRMNIEKWHPPYGESHVKYHVWQAGGGDNPVIWGATHHGLAIGPKTFKSPLGLSDKDYTRTSYEHEDDPERIGRFKTPEKARAAAEQHYRDNYSTPPRHDYDIDKIMNDNPQAPTGGKGGMGDDEDYGHIFGMHARYAAAISGVSDAVRQRIAAELSPPCPDCGQVAGFDEHMVSPRVKVCRNCEYPMTDIGHDDLLEGILRGHDQAVDDLPETDHPNLGKHGALDDDPMPDDPNQIEMFTPVPVKPDPRWSGNAILCRNCGHPKSHHGYGARKLGPCPTNRRNDGILPRTRWANLGNNKTH